MKILFICQANKFRSLVAEKYLKTKDPSIEVVSGGIIRSKPLSRRTIRTVKKLGIDLSKGGSKEVKESDLKTADLVVDVANNVPKSLFTSYNRNVIWWKIPDVYNGNQKDVVKVTKTVMLKVDKLIKQINSGKIK